MKGKESVTIEKKYTSWVTDKLIFFMLFFFWLAHTWLGELHIVSYWILYTLYIISGTLFIIWFILVMVGVLAKHYEN